MLLADTIKRTLSVSDQIAIYAMVVDSISNEELVQYMKLETLKKRLAIGLAQAEQGKFVDQSVSDIITEVRNA